MCVDLPTKSNTTTELESAPQRVPEPVRPIPSEKDGMIFVLRNFSTAMKNQSQNQNQNQNQFEIIRNSNAVPVPEFQYCPEFQNFRIPPQRLTRIPASVAEGGMVGQEFPRGHARDTRARPTQYSDPA